MTLADLSVVAADKMINQETIFSCLIILFIEILYEW